MKTWISFIVSCIIIHLSNADQEVLAASNVCYSSTDFSASTIFTAPKDGTVKAVRLEHRSGKITCDYQYVGVVKSHEGYWGCGYENYATMNVMKVTDAASFSGVTYYPSYKYTNHGLVAYKSCTTSRCDAAVERYSTYNKNMGKNDDEKILFSQPSYPVSTTDKFMLQLGFTSAFCKGTTTSLEIEDESEELKEENTFNIAGGACADVYFIYTDEPVDPPSASTDYFVSASKFSRSDAELFCQNQHGTSLATISGSGNNDDVQALCRTTGDSTPCWIGVTDFYRKSSKSIRGTWADGTTYDSNKVGGFFWWFHDKKVTPNTGAIVPGNGLWYPRAANEKYRALCNKPDDAKTERCCTAKDLTNSRELQKCVAAKDEKACGKKSYCKYVACDTTGYCSSVTMDIFADKKKGGGKSKKKKGDNCDGKTDETDCVAAGCQWNVGNPPREYLDELVFEEELEENMMMDIHNGLNETQPIYMMNYNIPALLCVAVMICGVYGYYKNRNGYVGYEKLSNEGDGSNLVNNTI